MDTPLVDLAFQEFGMRYLVLPGGEYGQLDLVRAAGLPEPLPEPLMRLLKAADDVNHRALARPQRAPLFKQWNPYSGSWAYEVRRAYAADEDDTRWMIRLFDDQTRCLFDTLHESTHGQLAAIGQMGLLGCLGTAQRLSFNTISEALAVLIGDIEGHAALSESGYLETFWPPSNQRSHAVALNPHSALSGAGFSTSDERAHWLFGLYASGKEGFKNLSCEPSRRASALAFLVEESGYAQKVRQHVAPTWERLYWQRPEIGSYLTHFVPAQELCFPHIPDAIDSVRAVRTHWHALTLGWEPLPDPWRRYLACRIAIQRNALKAYELKSTFSNIRCRLGDHVRNNALEALAGYIDKLKLHFRHFEKCRGELSTEGTDALMSDLAKVREATVRCLQSIVGQVVLIDHPWLDDSMMAYRWPSLTEAGIDEKESGYCTSILEKLILETRSVLAAVDDNRSKALFEDAHSLLGHFMVSPDSPELLIDFRRLLSSVRTELRLSLPYDLEWIIHEPYIEPRDGFRYT